MASYTKKKKKEKKEKIGGELFSFSDSIFSSIERHEVSVKQNVKLFCVCLTFCSKKVVVVVKVQRLCAIRNNSSVYL